MLPVDAAHEVLLRCRQLAAHTEEPGHITRSFLSVPMRAVHDDLSSWMRAAGMQVTVDAGGNIRGVYEGLRPGAPRLYIGSHLDSVRHAGAFDGILGVVMGLALVQLVTPRRLPFSLEVIGFSEEEGMRFGVPFIGSRAFAGTVDEALLDLVDAGGSSVRQAIVEYGLDPSGIPLARFTTPALGYLEFHIEQGPVLDNLDLPLGIVKAIVGQSRANVTFIGHAAHAGTTPMPMRHDALAAAAEWIGAVEALASGTPDLVATVGKASVTPGAANVIAGACRTTLDVRHADDGIRQEALRRTTAAAHAITARRGVSVEWDTYLDQPAVAMHPGLVALLGDAAASAGFRAPLMNSGAGHDAMVVAPLMPAAMLFVRSPGGISHHPDETVREDDVAVALDVGLRMLDLLAEQVRD